MKSVGKVSVIKRLVTTEKGWPSQEGAAAYVMYPNSSRESHAPSITKHPLCPLELLDRHLTDAEINTDPALRRDVARTVTWT